MKTKPFFILFLLFSSSLKKRFFFSTFFQFNFSQNSKRIIQNSFECSLFDTNRGITNTKNMKGFISDHLFEILSNSTNLKQRKVFPIKKFSFVLSSNSFFLQKKKHKNNLKKMIKDFNPFKIISFKKVKIEKLSKAKVSFQISFDSKKCYLFFTKIFLE